MSILTDLWEKKITFSQAAAKIGDFISNLANTNQGVAAVVATVETDAKQAASDAITLGDTALGNVLLPFVKTLEPGLDAALIRYAGPFGAIAVPVTNDAIDKITATVISEANAWSLKAKAALSPPKAASPQ